MKIIRDIDNIPEDLTGSIVTIGNFDGVHLGHREIFRNIVKEAGEKTGSQWSLPLIPTHRRSYTRKGDPFSC